MTDLRVLFAGTPEFACASLQALVEGGVVPIAVLTQPDRRAGRGKRMTASPVKKFAADREIDVMQPRTLRDTDTIAAIAALQPDIMIVAAYGLILPQDVLDIPKHGCLNVHASLLPRWRGAAPIQAAILAGDTTTGISLMSMTAGLDCGPVFATQQVEFDETTTAGDLHDELAKTGGRFLLANLDAIVSGELAAEPQDDELATYAGKISSADAELDWQLPAIQLERRVRAYNPEPGAWFTCDGERVKCLRAAVMTAEAATPGSIVSIEQEFVVIACGEGALSLRELQRPGRRPVSAQQFAAQKDLRGKILG